MATDITTKMGVTGLSGYKKAMGDAAASVKTLDEALKLNEEQLKLNGDQEVYMANKVRILKDRIEAQRKVVQNAEAALKEMRENGVDPSSKSFQTMQQRVFSAATKLTSMKTELRNVESGAQGAKNETAAMNTELQNVGKGIAWQNVSDGLHKITDSLQSGARAAVNFGKKLITSAKGATGYADEIKTIVAQYEDMGLSADRYQRMKNVEEFIDTPVEAILTAQQRMQKATASSGGKKTLEETLGISLSGQNAEDLFWEIGDALMNMGESFDKESAAQTMFGRSWRELVPLFKAGREEYEKALSEQNVLTDEQVDKLGQADDAIKSVEQEIELLKRQFWADNADKITDMLEWIVDNKDGIVTALEVIGGAFAAMKIGQFAIDIGQAVNGMKELIGLGGGNAGAGAGTGTAASGAKAAATGGGKGWIATAAGAVKDFFLGGAGTAALVTGTALAPAMIAMNDTWAKSEEKRASRAESARTSNSPDAQFLARAAEALVLRNGQNQDYEAIKDLLMGLESRQNQQRAELYNTIQQYAPTTSDGNYTWNQLMRLWAGEEIDLGAQNALLEAVSNAFQGKIDAENAPKVPIAPEVQDGAAADISEQIGVIPVAVTPQVIGGVDGEHANGIWAVPFNGYHAILHKGERIVPAREVAASRNFSSNLYVESMYMNNGQDADGLAAAMAAAQRRTMSGYGS